MSKRKKHNVRKQRRMLIYVLALVLVVLSWVRLTSKQTLILHNQRYTTTYDTQTFLLKNEQVFYFGENAKSLVESGERVSKQTVLFESEIAAGSQIPGTNALFGNYENTPEGAALAKEFAALVKEEGGFHSEEEKSRILQDLKQIVAAFSYTTSSEEAWALLKNQGSATVSSGRTLSGLGGRFPGYFVTKTDGYESILTPENMEGLVDLPAETMIKGITLLGETKAGFKIINDNTAYYMVYVPKDFFEEQSAQALERKSSILKDREDQSFTGYLDQLNRRADLLRSMPQLRYFMEDQEHAGFLIDVLEPEAGDQKVLILQLKDPMTLDFLQKRTVDLQLIRYDNQGYLVPTKSLVEEEGKFYIVVLNKGYLRKNLEVSISDEQKDQVFLSRKDNPDITEGMQLLINP